MRDTVGLAAIKLGHRPGDAHRRSSSTPRWPRSTRPSRPASSAQVTGNSYVEVMAAGDAVSAWPGPATSLSLLVPDQTEQQDFQWALPTEGGMLWTDNMVIPKGAANKAQAELWIDFYYGPENAATVEAWVNYVCPVKGAARGHARASIRTSPTTRSSSRPRR